MIIVHFGFWVWKNKSKQNKKRSCRHNQVLNYSTLKAYFSFNVPFLQKKSRGHMIALQYEDNINPDPGVLEVR